jgi:hypothetical protein
LERCDSGTAQMEGSVLRQSVISTETYDVADIVTAGRRKPRV